MRNVNGGSPWGFLERRTLPGLDRRVSAIGAGCWTIGGPATNNGVPIGWDGVDPDTAYAALVHAHELGINVFDTADVYGLGHSERLLGRLLRDIRRDDVVVSSKVGYFAGTGRHPYDPRQMRHQLATTLDNLGTDYLDVYFLHSSDFGPDDQYLADAVDLMHDWRASGVIRAIGMRAPHTFAQRWAEGTGPRADEAARFLELFHAIRPDVLTARYNLLSPLYHPEDIDIFDFAWRHNVGVMIKQALGQGLLLGRHRPEAARTLSRADHRTQYPAFTAEALRSLDDRLAPLRARFGDQPQALARVALRYALDRDPDSIVLVGFRDPGQIRTNVTCLGDSLTEEDLAAIRTALHPDAPEGHR